MGGGRDEEIENLMTLETERNYYVKSQNHGFFFFVFFLTWIRFLSHAVEDPITTVALKYFVRFMSL